MTLSEEKKKKPYPFLAFINYSRCLEKDKPFLARSSLKVFCRSGRAESVICSSRLALAICFRNKFTYLRETTLQVNENTQPLAQTWLRH